MEYRRTARRHWMFYAATNAGFLVALLALQIETGWLRASIILIGLLLFCGSLLLIIRNWQFGSRVDFETHELIWWEGYPPSDERRVPLEQIHAIEIVDQHGSRQLKIFDIEGRTIEFSSRCAPAPWEAWVQKINADIPKITLRRNSSVERGLRPIAEIRDSGTPADLQ